MLRREGKRLKSSRMITPTGPAPAMFIPAKEEDVQRGEKLERAADRIESIFFPEGAGGNDPAGNGQAMIRILERIDGHLQDLIRVDSRQAAPEGLAATGPRRHTGRYNNSRREPPSKLHETYG